MCALCVCVMLRDVWWRLIGIVRERALTFLEINRARGRRVIADELSGAKRCGRAQTSCLFLDVS